MKLKATSYIAFEKDQNSCVSPGEGGGGGGRSLSEENFDILSVITSPANK